MENNLREKLLMVTTFLPIVISQNVNESEILPKPLPLASPERSAIDHANFDVSYETGKSFLTFSFISDGC